MLIYHIDANSAYLSWTAAYLLEQGHDIDLRTIPSAIAGDPNNRHGIICLRHNLNKNFLSWENYFSKKCFPFYSCRDGKRLCRNNKGQHFFGASLVGAHFLFCPILEIVNFAKFTMHSIRRTQ